MSDVQTDLYGDSGIEKGDWVNDLKPGIAVEGIFAVARAVTRKKKDGSLFLSLALQDRTGSVDAVAWDHAHMAERLGTGSVVRISGEVGEYRERSQVKVFKLEIIEKEIPRRYLIAEGPQDREALGKKLEGVRSSITRPYLKRLLEMVFEEEGLLEPYLEAPAAKLRHQAYIGGLAEHSLNMAEHAIYCSTFYTELDVELLVTAAILHDVGKIFEYRLDTVIDYSDEGRLEGHIVIGERLVRRLADSIPDFPQEERMHLSHLILSHQGRLEYGSPVVPKTLEAVVLYALDLLDSRVASYRDIKEKHRGEERTWSEYDRMDERFWYLGGNSEGESGAGSDSEAD